MGASFVDIGLGRNAFLYVDDINKTPLNIGDVEITQPRTGWTITEKVNRGDDVLVQIVKEPRGLKGARVSTNISLPGRYLILMPNGRFSGVSRKIESAEERNRLKAMMKLIRPEGMATVVRTSAAGVSQAELIADLGVLIRMWHGILESYKRAEPPALIHKDMNLVYKAARDFITPEVDRVLIDDAAEFEKVREFMRLLGPQYVDRIQHYNNGRALFKDFKIDEALQKLMRPKVNLPSGGSIVIETTEALTVIDVNSGKFTGGKNLDDTIVKTNVEAAAEIARQVRLRDIGGIIVCDFIDMSSEAARTKVIDTLKAGLVRDRTRTTIQSFSNLGLLEFTRKRIGKDLGGQLRGHCPSCSGLGSVMSPESVAIEAFRGLRQFGAANKPDGVAKKQAPIEVFAAPTVGAQLEYWYEDELLALEAEVGRTINVRVDLTLHPEHFRIALGATVAKSAEVDGKAVRVGDEIEVELVQTRLPNAASGLAIVGDRLVEVENAANAAGQTVKIKLIDIDEDGNILAEPRALAAAAPLAATAAGEGKRRRRRGGRGRHKELTVAEQTEELRELAEEAAKGIDARAAIGISTGPEPEDDVEARARAAERKLAAPQLATVTPIRPGIEGIGPDTAGGADTGDGRRRKRRRRRRRGASDVTPIGANPQAADSADDAADEYAEQNDGIEGEAPAAGEARTDAGADAGADADADAGTDAEQPVAYASWPPTEEGTRRPRRRRRRRRGRGGITVLEGGAVPQPGAVPERQIFRVGSDGAAEATGEQAPPEPSRALAPRRRGTVAVDAPPPSLTLPEEAPKLARPVRGRRRGPAAVPPPPLPLETASAPALPVPAEPAAAPAETAAAPVAAPKRRGRPPKAAAAPVASPLAAVPPPTPSPAPVPAAPEPVAPAPEPAAPAARRAASTGRKPAAAPKAKTAAKAAAAPAEAPKKRATRKAAAEPVAEAPKKRAVRKAAAPAAPAKGGRLTSSRTAGAAKTAAAKKTAAKKAPAKKTAAKKTAAKKTTRKKS
jgi:ribonuclease G